MTERELLAVVSAIVFEGSNDTAIAAVQRAAHILQRVEEAILASSHRNPSATSPHQMSGLGAVGQVNPEEELHEHTTKKRAK